MSFISHCLLKNAVGNEVLVAICSDQMLLRVVVRCCCFKVIVACKILCTIYSVT